MCDPDFDRCDKQSARESQYVHVQVLSLSEMSLLYTGVLLGNPAISPPQEESRV